MPSRRDLSADLPVDFSPLAREEFLHEVRYYAARGQALRFIAAVVEALDRVHRRGARLAAARLLAATGPWPVTVSLRS